MTSNLLIYQFRTKASKDVLGQEIDPLVNNTKKPN